MLNIVIPMAGLGQRFRKIGYTVPKPLIPIHGKPMVQVVTHNLRPQCEHCFIFLCLKEHVEKYDMDKLLLTWNPGSCVLEVEEVTEGAACTVLLAKEFINNGDPLMIANCDQWIDVDIDRYLEYMDLTHAEGLIMTMRSDDPKWSYVRLNGEGIACEVVEKKVISNEATVGIYNYRQGKYFVNATEKMIAKNLRVNNEFYVAPTYNELINENMKILTYNIGREFDGMYGLGVPEDVKRFEHFEVSKKAVTF